MKFIDITLPISQEIPVWPGDPEIQISWLARIENGDEANITQINFCTHTGTHIDAPLHFIEGGDSVDLLDISVLIGNVDVIEIPENISTIDDDFLLKFGDEVSERVIFKTRNSNVLDRSDKEFNEDYVAIDASGAQWLVEHQVRLVGIDYLSIATYRDTVLPHKILLNAGVIVVENLYLKEVDPGKYRLICLPLKLVGREGAPARAILQVLDCGKEKIN